jgi:transcriptional regulator with XRE-family HTH domain
MDKYEIGRNIRKYRRQAQMTMEQLATETGLSYRLIQKYDTGWIIPNVDTVLILAKALNVSTHKLLGEVEPMDLVPKSMQEELIKEIARRTT